MANALFDAYKETMLGLGTRVDLDADNVRFGFFDHGVDTPSPTADDFLDDIVTAMIDESANLTGLTITDGAFNTNDATVTTVSGNQFESVVLFKETGTDSTSNLMAFYDTATGLPFTPSGGDVTVVVHGSGWFSI